MKQNSRFLFALAAISRLMMSPVAMSEETADAAKAHPLAGIALRSIGAAVISGRISDFAFHPQSPNIFYVATASGGLWKTSNRGTTWTPVFDNEGAFAIGWVELNPDNPDEVWA